MEHIAIYSNNDDLTIKVIEKIEKDYSINKGKMKPSHFNGMVYVPNVDLFVSHLALEMAYPEYKLIYATEYLES